MERTGIITFKGQGMTLLGQGVKVGDEAPDFAAVDSGLAPVRLSDFKGQVIIISAVPSLDTPVCELQTTRFNEEASSLKAKIVTISMDLPFAQKRFCSVHDINNITLLSDYQERDFAMKYGLLIKELKLIARAIFVIGKDGRIAYMEIVPEVTNHPDYDKALEAAKRLIS
ncbi:MAG: putative thiol peroxidase [candidate division BRC1 bacterium ADurb.Bin183]|nr:MAG: putative thiol peroxidase [candidate division BRC1 bacterium ADurb.Bin183]